MQKRVLKTLEYYKIIDRLTELCMSEPGVELSKKSEPTNNKLEILRLQEQTREAHSYMMRHGDCPMRAFSDVRDDVNRAKMGGMLMPLALLRVASFLQISRVVKKALAEDEDGGEVLKTFSEMLVAVKSVEDEINRCIFGEDEISDNASTTLYGIRRDIRQYEQKIRSKLESMVKSLSKYLQEPIVTIRNDRLVLPVKAEYKASIQGIVHDVSSTGATLFVEPAAAVEMGNAIRELETKEQQEIERILKELSGEVARYAKSILTSLDTLTEIDYIFARAKLALDMDATCPVICEERVIELKKARHPLIPKDEIVPVDIKIGGDYSQLIITGPNTGGKTVTLKTTGLLTLMAQTGLHIPADENSKICVMKEVYADIGDEQSIEQSLSTFSSHMKNIVSILDSENDDCLILLDELGAGTDPVEGAALAVSILEKLMETKALVMATTHYSELKSYALTEENVQNASMEFDVKKLSPTYHMIIGMPGKSNAFEISKRLGLKEDIIKQAELHISTDAKKLEDVIYKADLHRKTAHRERLVAEQLRKDTEQYEKRAKEKSETIDRQEKKILDDAKIEAQKIIDKAKLQSEEIIQELKKAQSKDADRSIQEARDSIRDMQKGVDVKAAKTKNEEVPKELVLGDSVLLIDSNTPATVISVPDKRGDVQVQAGVMKLKTNISNLKKWEEKPQKKKLTSKGGGLKLETVSMELDIRGRNGEEGIMEVDMYLDRAYSSHLQTVHIIHGKGTGVLRQQIHRHLKQHPIVKSFRLGKYGEGEDGVTVVELK